jgi:hypothetical protein
MKNEKDIMNEAIHVYGYENQVNKFIEESGECIASVMRYKINPNIDTQSHMFEELADLGIMIEQMNIMFEQGDIQKFRKSKIQRLEQRLKDIRYEKK